MNTTIRSGSYVILHETSLSFFFFPLYADSIIMLRGLFCAGKKPVIIGVGRGGAL